MWIIWKNVILRRCFSQHIEKDTVLRLFWFVYIMTSWGPFYEKKSAILVLLDLSAAFDTVDHDRLLAVLNSRIDITGAALSWFESDLKGRTQHVAIKNLQSSMTKLKCGVLQGSVLGPVRFTTYLLPLGDSLRKFGVQFHCYADDTQLYIPFSQNDHSCLGSIEECVSEIQIGWRPTFSNSMQKKHKWLFCLLHILPRHGRMTWLLT